MTDYYTKDIFRKLKFRRFVNKKSHENQFLNSISKKFKTDNRELMMCIGDWSNKNSIKHTPSTMGIGLKKMISKKYKTVLLNEYNTSKKCSKCHKDIKSVNDIFRLKYCDCATVCQNNKIVAKKQFINRDKNACLNMLYIVNYMINNKMERPIEYKRNSTTVG
jgi:hypothetical protein